MKIKSVEYSGGIKSKLATGRKIAYKMLTLAGKLTFAKMRKSIIYSIFAKHKSMHTLADMDILATKEVLSVASNVFLTCFVVSLYSGPTTSYFGILLTI